MLLCRGRLPRAANSGAFSVSDVRCIHRTLSRGLGFPDALLLKVARPPHVGHGRVEGLPSPRRLRRRGRWRFPATRTGCASTNACLFGGVGWMFGRPCLPGVAGDRQMKHWYGVTFIDGRPAPHFEAGRVSDVVCARARPRASKGRRGADVTLMAVEHSLNHRKCTSKGIMLKHRNSLQKSLCPIVICPYSCTEITAGARGRRTADGEATRPRPHF